MSTSSDRMLWAYGLGSIVRVGENLIAFYLVYFLTTVAGVNAATAGAVSGGMLLLGAVVSLVVGHLSDRSASRFGQRRVFMIVALVPFAAFLMLLFSRIDLGAATEPFYIAIACLYIVAYYVFLVPYDALGSMITDDPARRTRIRAVCTVVLYATVLIGGTAVIALEGALSGVLDPAASWTVAVASLCSVPSLVLGFVAWRATRGVDVGDRVSPHSGERPWRSVANLLRLRSVRALLTWGLIFFCADALSAGTTIYFGVYVIGLSEDVTSLLFVVGIASSLLFVLIADVVSRRMGKRNTVLAGIAVYAVVAIAVFVSGPDSIAHAIVLAASYGAANAAALTCGYSMLYDVREVTLLRFRSDSTAVLVGMYMLVIAVGAAVAYAGLGTVLELSGFDGEALGQGEGVVSVIAALSTIAPAVLAVLSGIALLTWRLDSATHSRITGAIALIDGQERDATLRDLRARL